MRQQYHFRESERGTLIWDVNKLVELTRDLPILEIPLIEIDELTEEYWFTHSKPTVEAVAKHARLIQEVDLSYPIILCHEGRVMDGMHRVARAFLEGMKTISAVQLQDYIPPDYENIEPKDLPY